MPANPLGSRKGSFSALLGSITRQINRFDKIKTLPPTPTSLAQIQEYLDTAQKAVAKLDEVCLEIAALDPDSVDEYQARVKDATDRFDTFAQAAGTLLAAGIAAPAQPVAAAPAPAPQQQQVKVVQVLEPHKLSLDNTPAEFYLWTESFKAYFSASRLDKLEPKDQHAFFFACLDAELHKRVRPNVLPDTPVFSPDPDTGSVLSLVDDIFKHRYPLVQRRFEFFQYPHSAGQLASTWISELRMRGDIADLGDLTTDQLYAYRVITGVQDADLQDELLKLKDPSLNDVEATTLQYEAKLSTKAKTSLHRIQSRNTSRRGPPNSSPSTSTSAPSSGARCGRCNKSGHIGRDCFYTSAVICHRCGRMGHIAPACRQAVAARALSDVPAVDDTSPVSVRVLDIPNQPTPRINLQFRQGSTVFSFLALPDSGATRTIVAHDLIVKYGLVLNDCKELIMVANGERIRCAGSLTLTASFGNVQAEINALVTPDVPNDIFLSWHDLKALNILHSNFPFPIVRAMSSPILNKLFEHYSDVVSDTLGDRCLQGPPMTIHLRKDMDIHPFKIYTTKQIPLHLRAEADAAVQRALDDGVICPEPEPTEWCCRGGFVPKPSGKLRLITDFIPLNKYVMRPVHPFPSAVDIIQSISPDSVVFAVLDCTMGYFQVPLDERSSKLTTFLLPQGRFRYKRAPMGLSASSDEFCRRSDIAIAGLVGVHKLVDDILVQAPSVDILLERLHHLLDRCRSHGLTLSKRKAQFVLGPQDSPIKFAGYLLSAKGVQPDPDKVSALKKFPVPGTVTELRSFLGLANQLGFFVPDLAHLTLRMRLLLKKNVAFVWDADMEEDFHKIKDILSSNLVVQPFDPKLKTQLITDASRVGLGYALLQLSASGKPRLIQCGSRSLIPAETRYATIELECLAVTYAMSKCDYYLRGLTSFQLLTDHRPLVGIFEKSLPDIGNPRIQRFREKIAMYNFHILWIAGKNNSIADALSRAPHFPPDGQDHIVVAAVAVEDIRVQHMERAASEDPKYCQVVRVLLEGTALSRLGQDHPAQSYSNVWPRLSVLDGILVLDGNRIVPPVSQRSEILTKLHASHSGIVRTRKQAQQLYYWPGMNNQIKMMVESCSRCQMLQPSQSFEPQIHTRAQFPMQEVSVDPFEYAGRHYLLMVDRFSGYIWVEELRQQHTSALLRILLSWFFEYGFPTSIRTDGGPQFRSEFEGFCKTYDIIHDTTSPMYPVSNGHAEANVKSAKHLLIKCSTAKENFRLGLMELRNTPRGDGYSPAQLFFGRRQRTLLPCIPEHFSKSIDLKAGDVAREKAHDAKISSSEHRAVPLVALEPGQRIIMQNVRTKRWEDCGVVLSRNKTGRSYWVRLPGGKVSWRNRKYLRPIGSLVTSAASMPATSSTVTPSRTLRPSTRINYRLARDYKRKNSSRK